MAFSVVLGGHVSAVIVAVPTLSTGGESLDPGGLSHGVSTTELTVNLEDRSGLTPGSPIRLAFNSPDPVIWIGGIVYGPGTLIFPRSCCGSARTPR